MSKFPGYYITLLKDDVSEGGQSRTTAFLSYFKNRNWNIINVFSLNNLGRIKSMCKNIPLLFLLKNKTIFIHIDALMFLFSITLLNKPAFRNKFVSLLIRLSKRNKVIIEVNDLPYEQAIDVGFAIVDLYKYFQDGVFSVKNIRFIFASDEMKKYTSQKFHLKNVDTIINGSNLLNESILIPDFEWQNASEMKCIYAGTLNQGRGIEDLLNLFRSHPNIILVLMGTSGEWLLDQNLPENVKYIGSYPEKIAHKIVSTCDLGIIHYDASKFYYNLCYPTKASFYIAAKIPFLSTPLTELKSHFANTEGTYFIDFDKWGAFLETITQEELIKAKTSISRIYNSFTWPHLQLQLDEIMANS